MYTNEIKSNKTKVWFRRLLCHPTGINNVAHVVTQSWCRDAHPIDMWTGHRPGQKIEVAKWAGPGINILVYNAILHIT